MPTKISRWAIVLNDNGTKVVSSIIETESRGAPSVPSGYEAIEAPRDILTGMIQHGDGWEFPSVIAANIAKEAVKKAQRLANG